MARKAARWDVVVSPKERRAGEFFIRRGKQYVLKVYKDSVPDPYQFAHWLANQLEKSEQRGLDKMPSAITNFTGKHRFLSNFYPVEIRLNDDMEIYPSVEHAYQAAKCPSAEMRKRIRECKHPAQAKRMGRQVATVKNWPEIRLAVMEELLFQKFTCNDLLYKLLMETGNQQLIEDNTWGDTFWGVCDGKGENHLGRLLMLVRDTLRYAEQESE